METTYHHYIGTLITLLIVSFLGYRSSSKVKTSQDFAVGGRGLNGIQVSGSVIATIVGGASTIGTAQLAFEKGISAMWFTLGASAACLFLGLFIAKPLRRAEVDTVSQFLSSSYGYRAGMAASMITSTAIFIHITGQILSAVAITTSMFHMHIYTAVLLTVCFMMSYILFGGFLGTSIVGIAKTILLYSVLIFSSGIILQKTQGLGGVLQYFPTEPWFNLFSDGISKNTSQGFSMIVGIASTQTYLQAMFSGKNEKESVKGAFLSAGFILPIGLICTLIGMYMKMAHPQLDPRQALPVFILSYLHPYVGGIAIAALIISVIGTAAGLTMGIGTMIHQDIYLKYIQPNATEKKQLWVIRLTTMLLCALAGLVTLLNVNSFILKWGFLSMALRGTTVFIPLMFAIYGKEKIYTQTGLTAIIAAPAISVIWGVFFGEFIDPLYIGLACSMFIFLTFGIKKKAHIDG
ncbi:MAG: sodium:solute symporter family protein [Bacillota bacterium]